jgi:hypothetical protein
MNPKALGKGFEREIAHKLTELLRSTEHLTEDQQFYRVIGSGMLSYHRHLLTKEVLDSMVGDVYGPYEFPFVVECKRRRENPGFHKVVTNKDKKHEIYSWLDQVLGDATTSNKIPLLIMKFIPNMGTYVCMEHVTWKQWQPIIDIKFRPNFLYLWHPTTYSQTDPQAKGLWVVMSWAQFEEMAKEDYDGWLMKQMKINS